MKIDRHGVQFSAGWESFVPWVYDDKAKAVVTDWHGVKIKAPPRWQPGTPVKGTLTAGFGHTDAGKHPLKMHELIARGTDLSEDEAYDILDVDLDDCESAVNRLVKVPLSQGQFNALCDLVLNFGAGNFKKSALLARLNNGDYAGARAAFDLYVNSGGQRLAGLVRRRDAEQLMWDEGGAVARSPDIEQDFEETPKGIDRPAPPKSLGQSNTVKGALATGMASAPPIAGAAIKAANEAVPDAAPTITERVTEVVDRAGNVIDTVKTVQESLPQVPEGFWAKFAHVATDPVVMACFGIVVLGGLAFIVYERWRKLRYEGA